MDFYKKAILSKIPEYLKKFKIPHEARGKVLNMQCPFCQDKALTAQGVASTHLINCLNPQCKRKDKFTLISIVKHTESDKKDWDNEQIVQYLKELFQVKVLTPKDQTEIDKWFNYYEKNNFSLVPNSPNSKESNIEKNWQHTEHKVKSEWLEWLKTGLNVGLNCGLSKKTVIDIDQKPIPEEIIKLKGNTLEQETRRGTHLIYNHCVELPKTLIGEFTLVDNSGKEIIIDNPNTTIKIGAKNKTLRTMELEEKGILKLNATDIEVTLKKYLKLDIENAGGQVILFPSIVEGIGRKFINDNPTIDIPKEFVDYLKKKIKKTAPKTTNSELMAQEIVNETYKRALLCEGDGRHDYIFHLGCILRKQLSVGDTEFVLGAFNKISCSPQLPYSEMKNISNSILNYNFFDEKELANQILQYLKDVSEASLKDIERIVMGDTRLKAEEKEKIDKVIAYLRKEELIQKRGNIITPVKKLEWQTDLLDELKPLPFKVPYFDDLAYFSWREMIIIGMKTGQGKTHLAMNIIQRLKQQNIKPKYISLEKGSKFKKNALQLGLIEGDFEYANCYEPSQIELEKNAVTTVDWLNIPEFKNTHLTFGHFSQQLDKQGGFLIVLVQLKEDGSFFAPNLLDWFAVLVTKYIYDDDSDGSSGYFEIGKVRDRICKKRISKIPCKFNWETKELTRVDEIKNESNNSELREKLLESGNEENNG